jgi:hypothetical protein
MYTIQFVAFCCFIERVFREVRRGTPAGVRQTRCGIDRYGLEGGWQKEPKDSRKRQDRLKTEL